MKGISRSFVFDIGILVLLGTLGISITPLIASLGIGSLAVALALQPTLDNFFSGVHYDSDLEHVETVVKEVGKKLMEEHEFGVPTHDPIVFFHTFDNSSINFTVILKGQEFFHQLFLRAAFIKQLHKRFKAENIVIPYPIRAINTEQENARIIRSDE